MVGDINSGQNILALEDGGALPSESLDVAGEQYWETEEEN